MDDNKINVLPMTVPIRVAHYVIELSSKINAFLLTGVKGCFLDGTCRLTLAVPTKNLKKFEAQLKIMKSRHF